MKKLTALLAAAMLASPAAMAQQSGDTAGSGAGVGGVSAGTITFGVVAAAVVVAAADDDDGVDPIETGTNTSTSTSTSTTTSTSM